MLIFLVADFINFAVAKRMLQKLNSKLNLIKTTFERDIDELKYNVLDLSTELELERYRTSELEKLLNETLRKGYELPQPGDGTVGPQDNAVIKKLNEKLDEQEKQLKQISQELKGEKAKRLTLETTVGSLKDQCEQVHTQESQIMAQQTTINEMKESLTNVTRLVSDVEGCTYSTENETDKIRTSVDLFTSSMKLAFKAEKSSLRKLSNSMKNDTKLTELVQREIQALAADTNISLEAVKNNVSDLQNNVDEVSWLVRVVETKLGTLRRTTGDSISSLNSAVDLLEETSDANKQILKEVSECCSQQAAPTPATVTDLVPVTLKPGGPYILPLYEEELAKAIRIGSRVVRGRDWVWHSQDGTPPGPGTVVSWYGGKRSSNQVNVKWDRGTKANYRIGAHNKYDLYLLANQTHYPNGTRTDIQPIFGAALEDAIKIGSRVVRGKDWSWGSQDGDPPTPGTVTAWYRGNKSSKQVMVKWDSGQTVNYRVGAHGKYDLYLLKEQYNH